MQKDTVFLSLDAADDNGICTSQKPAAGGVQSLTLNGALVVSGVGITDIPRRIAITSDADDTGRVFTITGSKNGNTQVEAIAGPNGAVVYTKKDFDKITSITIDDDAAGNLIVGTNEVASSRWIIPDYKSDENGVSLSVQLYGSLVIGHQGRSYKCIKNNTSAAANYPGVGADWRYYWEEIEMGLGKPWVTDTAYVSANSLTCTVEHTFDDLQQSIMDINITVFAHDDLAAISANEASNYAFPVTGIRLTVNSFTSGTALIFVNQGDC